MVTATNPSVSNANLPPLSLDQKETSTATGANTNAATSTQSQTTKPAAEQGISAEAYDANFSTTRDPASVNNNQKLMINPNSVNPNATRVNVQGQMEQKPIVGDSRDTKAAGINGQLIAIGKPKDVINGIKATFEAASGQIAKSGLTKHIIENHIEHASKSLFKDVATGKNAIRETLDAGVKALDNLTPAEMSKLAKDGKLVLKDQGLRIYQSTDKNGVSMIIEKKLEDAVGTQGEKIVKVVTDVALGTLITAFPVLAFNNMSSAQATAVNDSFTKSVTGAIKTVNAMPTPDGGKHGWVADLIGFLDPTGILSTDKTVSGAQETRGLLSNKAVVDAEKAAGRSFSEPERDLFQKRWLDAVMVGIEDRNK